MELTFSPGRPLRGRYTLPGDKSLSHRAALFTALADGGSQVDNFLVAGVTQAMLQALSALGVSWQLSEGRLNVQGCGLGGMQSPHALLDCGNSATTLRLLAGALSADGLPHGESVTLVGSPGLSRRPMERIIEPLRRMGVQIDASPQDTAPLTLYPRPEGKSLNPIEYTLPVASAQVKSCLLLAALAASGPTTLREPGPSRDHTERMLISMGVQVECWQEAGAFVTRLAPPPDRRLKPLHMALPGDMSAAAFLIVAALVTPGSQVELCNVGLNPTRTGLLETLQEMGGQIEITRQAEQGGEPVGDLLVNSSKLHGTIVRGERVVRMIDEFPALALAAAFARGETVVTEAEELRHKESDRIGALITQLNQLGVEADELPDGFSISGGSLPSGGRVDPHGDHRLAMSLALAGLAGGGPVTVSEAQIINESFPEFPEVLRSLGADVRETASI